MTLVTRLNRAAPRDASPDVVLDRHVRSCTFLPVRAATSRGAQLGTRTHARAPQVLSAFSGRDSVEQQGRADLELERELQHCAQVWFAAAVLVDADRCTIDFGIECESLL
jgi:hypothetical protein